jgi:cobyrinic acid a,c-diamide synthase
MVLGRALIDGEGVRHQMAGLLPLVASFAQPRPYLGYRCVSFCEDGPFGPSGSRFRGHEFHYAAVVEEDTEVPLLSARDAAGTDLGACGSRRGSVSGSFIHLIDRCDE